MIWFLTYVLLGLPVGRATVRYLNAEDRKVFDQIGPEERVLSGLIGLTSVFLWPVALLIWWFGKDEES